MAPRLIKTPLEGFLFRRERGSGLLPKAICSRQKNFIRPPSRLSEVVCFGGVVVHGVLMYTKVLLCRAGAQNPLGIMLWITLQCVLY